MNLSLFEDDDVPSSQGALPRGAASKSAIVRPAIPSPTIHALAAQLPEALHLGTSSWNFPGWAGLVWNEPYAETMLSRHGLAAYSQHPLLRTVSLDRAFYRPMSTEQYAQLANQVPDDFRFVVKVPSLISDPLLRATQGDEAGAGMQANPNFLNLDVMHRACLQPLAEGLGAKLGVLVLQMSPLPMNELNKPAILRLFNALAPVLSAQSAMNSVARDAVVALEVRNAELIQSDLRDELCAMLKDAAATYCLAGHARLPALVEQLPILRKLWPRPLVCRWNLNARHGRFGYQAAKTAYEPFDRLVDEDLVTRDTLAQVIAGTLRGGQKAFITINNKAEGSAPHSVEQLARTVAERLAL